jgi:integrase
MTLAEAVERYLGAIEGVRTEYVVANHVSVSKRFLSYFPGQRPLGELGPADVAAFLDWFTYKRGAYSAHTYNLGVEFVKRLTLFCLAQGWLDEDPAAEINYLQVEIPVPTVLNREEMKRLLAVALGDDLNTILVGFLGLLGLKKGELTSLRFADLRLDASIPVAVIRYSGKLQKKSRRLPLPKELAAAARNYATRRQTEAPFTSLDAVVPVTGRQVNNILARLCKEAGIRRANPQILRDTAAVNLLTAGRTPEQVARQLGYTPRGYLLEFLPRFRVWIEPQPDESS